MAEIVRHIDPSDGNYQIKHLARKKGENEKLDKFVTKLCEQIETAKTKIEKELWPEWEQCEKNYYAINERENWGQRDSNLDFTITFEICQDASSNLYNPIFAQDTVFLGHGRPGFKELGAQIDDCLDWMADQADYPKICDTTIRHSQIYTKTIVKCGWQYREETVSFWDGRSEGGDLIERKQKRSENSGCFPHVLDPRRFYHPLPCASIEEAAWIAEEFTITESAVYSEIAREFYRSDLDPKILGNEGAEGSVKSEATEALGIEEKRDTDEEDSPREIHLLECYTVFDGEEVIIYLDLKSKEWVAAIVNYFQSRKRPYHTFSWYEILNSIDGKSLCSIIDPEHRAYVGIMNILMDAGVRSVEPLIVALESLGLSEHLSNGRLGPGLNEASAPIIDDLRKGVVPIQLTNGDVRFLVDLLGRVEKHMRDAASIPAMFRGEEIADRPTATGTSSIMEKAMQPLNKLMSRYRAFLAEIAKSQYARYRQFYPERMDIYLMSKGESGQQLKQTILEFPPGYWEDQVLIEVKVNAQTMSKSVKKQEALAMIDKLPQIFQSLIPLLEMIASGGPMSPGAQVMLDTQLMALRVFFTEFEIPEVRDVLQIESAKMAGEAIAQAQSQLINTIDGLIQDLTAANSKLIEAGQEPVTPSVGGGGGGSGQPQAAA